MSDLNHIGLLDFPAPVQRRAAAVCSCVRPERVARAAAAFATVSPKHSPLLKFFAAAFIDGDRCLTDLAANKNFPMQACNSVANVAIDGAC
jgi:hypothetical protein